MSKLLKMQMKECLGTNQMKLLKKKIKREILEKKNNQMNFKIKKKNEYI